LMLCVYEFIDKKGQTTRQRDNRIYYIAEKWHRWAVAKTLCRLFCCYYLRVYWLSATEHESPENTTMPTSKTPPPHCLRRRAGIAAARHPPRTHFFDFHPARRVQVQILLVLCFHSNWRGSRFIFSNLINMMKIL
jgi:hypothetical protein